VPACPSCGAENPDRAKFCNECGAKLAVSAAFAEERKTVTTLFCDLVAFTAMSEVADPEDVDALLGEYFARATKVIESHGGTVEKFIGDAVVGVFGVPAVHEDDPERAVRAGLRILEALEGMTRPDGTPLEARCGVNTGEALVRLDVDPSSGRGFLTGDAVNTAARLEAAAPPGGVVVGALTHESSEHAVEYAELPPVAAKGKAEPVAAWRALRPRARTGLRTTGSARTPFVGRDRELEALLDALREAGDEAKGRFVLLVGEPGIGKSRLTLEFLRAVDSRPEMVTWRQGRCLPYGEGITFWALGEILREHAGILDSDDEDVVEDKLGAILPDGDDGPWLRRRLRPLLGLDSSRAGREENFEAWARFLELIAGPYPAVIVLEDLHWAGDAMLAFVDHVVTRGLEAPLLLVATTRPELVDRHTGALTSSGDRVRRSDLRGLGERHAEALATALLGSASSSVARAEVTGAAGGNPLYAEQIARLLNERGPGAGAGAEKGSRTGAGGERRLPGSLNAVLAARMDTLPAASKTLLSDAAVLGETFWRGGLIALSGVPAGDVDRSISVLLARDFVRPAATSSIQGEHEYLFWHALARDVAYGQLPRKTRARKHRAVAAWLEATVGERGDEFSEIVAHHYTTALDLARASRDAELADALVRPATAALTRAVDRALRLDVRSAERYLTRALELAGDDADARRALLPRRAKLLLVTDRYREAAAAYDEAVEGLLAAGDIRQAALALCWQGDARAMLGEPAMVHLQRALDLLADDGPSAELAEILAHHALSLVIHDDEPRLVLAATERAIEMSRSLGLPDPAVALSTRGWARLELGDLAGEEDGKRAERAAQEQGLGIERSTILLNHTGTAFVNHGAAAERDAILKGSEFISSHGLASYAGNFRGALIACQFKLGDWDDCLAEVADALPLLQGMEDEWSLLYIRALLTMIAVERGDARTAREHLGWLSERGRSSEVGWVRSYALIAVAMAHESRGEQEAAGEALETWLERPRGVPTVLDAVPQAIRTASRVDTQVAEAIAGAFEQELPVTAYPLTRLVRDTARASIAELGDDPEAAAAGFSDAAARWLTFAMPYEEAHALLGQGRCLAALGRAPEAAAPLAAARAIFARLGARPALREAEDLLASR
jgi:class 3 adenylate cyclase